MGRPKKNRKKLQYARYEWILRRECGRVVVVASGYRLSGAEALSCETFKQKRRRC
jgi:hypothetical protein